MTVTVTVTLTVTATVTAVTVIVIVTVENGKCWKGGTRKRGNRAGSEEIWGHCPSSSNSDWIY